MKAPKPALKGEKPLLDPKVEEEGVGAILKSLTHEEIASMPDEHMPLRHLRAEKGHVDVAIRKLKETLVWRQEFQVDKIVHAFDEDGDEELRQILIQEAATGKIYVRGYDCDGRVALYMRPHRENTHNALNNMRHLVYNLERAIACTTKRSGYEKINLMIDYQHFRVRDAPPMSTNRWTINILQNHYPERLYKAYILHPGFFFKTFLQVIRPFLDPVTRDKIVICGGNTAPDKVGQRFNLKEVEQCAGGEREGNFDSQEYLFKVPFDEALE